MIDVISELLKKFSTDDMYWYIYSLASLQESPSSMRSFVPSFMGVSTLDSYLPVRLPVVPSRPALTPEGTTPESYLEVL
jgi:hypothetical protein